MPFSEDTKLEAKRKSDFTCVICHQPFVQVHHIIPQADGGPDDLENAAPLCGSCHDLFGANPVKRKQIREMRDFWWEICEKKKANPDLIAINKKLDAIQEQISEKMVLLGRETSGLQFRGEYINSGDYLIQDVVLVISGVTKGTYVCVRDNPGPANPPWVGNGYWIKFPGDASNQWM